MFNMKSDKEIQKWLEESRARKEKEEKERLERRRVEKLLKRMKNRKGFGKPFFQAKGTT